MGVHRVTALTATMLLVACEGLIGDAGAPPGAPPGRPTPDCDAPQLAGAPVPMRRLTRPELEATIADVLMARATIPISDETLLGYRSNISSGFDTTSARTLMLSAEAVAVPLSATLASDPGCDVAGCGDFVLDTYGELLLRRPLDADTRARFVALYDMGVAEDGTAATGVRYLLEGLLQSPRFLYLLEATDGAGRLDGWSIASRLSYALWGGPPDRELLDAAAAGDLDADEGVAAAAERMIDDARFERGLTEFVVQWLGVELLDDPSSRSDVFALPDATRAAMRREPVAFLAAHVRYGSTIEELLRSSETPNDPDLATIYGDDIVSVTGDVATLDPTRRAGILTLPGVLAALSHAESTSPTRRGQRVLANLLCRPPPPPPAGVVATLPPPVPGATTRERLESHFSDTTCASCHRLMDGIGFAFEHYDWLGRYRDDDEGRPIDATADVNLGSGTVSVDGAIDLAAALAEEHEVAVCFATHLSRFAVGVRENADFSCTVEDLATVAEGPGGLRAMMVAYVTSSWFLAPATPSTTGGTP